MIPTATTYKKYSCNGTGPYPITFPCKVNSTGNAINIEAKITDSEGLYVATCKLSDSTLTTTLLNAYTSVSYDNTHYITIYFKMDFTFEEDITGGVPSSRLKEIIDDIYRHINEVKSEVTRSLRYPVTDNEKDAVIPSTGERVLRMLGFNAESTPIDVAQMIAAVTVTSFIEGLLDDTTAAAARATLGISDEYYTETELDAGQLDDQYYTETELDAGQLDDRYFTETEHINTSAGAGDAGKPLKLNASGLVDPTMIPSSLSWGVKSTSVDYVVLTTDGYVYILVTTGAADKTITLPTLADNQGRPLVIIKVDAGAGEVIVAGEGAETLEGFAALYIGRQYGALAIFGGAAFWQRTAGAIQPVAAEPSLGTPRKKYFQLLSTVPADTDWHSIDVITTASLPVGTTAVFVEARIRDTAGATIRGVISDESGGDELCWVYCTGTNYNTNSSLIPLDADGNIWWKVLSAAADNFVINMTMYYI